MKGDPWALVVGLWDSVEEHWKTIEQLTLQLSKKEAKLRKWNVEECSGGRIGRLQDAPNKGHAMDESQTELPLTPNCNTTDKLNYPMLS
jgi:hypothetical protein